jgi:hypothetical protein
MPVTTLLVGMHFAPPSQALIAAFSAQAHVQLVPDPDNQYDHQAIRVEWTPREADLIQDDEIRAKLEDDLAGYGRTWEEVLAEGQPIMLGHIGKDSNKNVIRAGLQGNATVYSMGLQNAAGKLAWDGNGSPTVVVYGEGEREVAHGDKLIA